MSQLQYPSLRQLFIDVFGTSYELETARNLFLEVLPYVRNEAAARLIRHLVIDQKVSYDLYLYQRSSILSYSLVG